MQPVLTDRDIKFVMDKRGRRKERRAKSIERGAESKRAEREEEMLPDREYDLTEAICEGVKEMGQAKKKKTFRLTARRLLHSGLIGLWKDRKDI